MAHEPTDAGPFGTRAQARGLVHHIYATGDGRTFRTANYALLQDTCRSAGVALGAYDHTALQWLAAFEPEVIAVVCGIVTRAWRAGHAARIADLP